MFYPKSGEGWIPWKEQEPRDMEIIVGLWGRTPYVVRYIKGTAGQKPGVYLHGMGPIGIGPFTVEPDAWTRLPSF